MVKSHTVNLVICGSIPSLGNTMHNSLMIKRSSHKTEIMWFDSHLCKKRVVIYMIKILVNTLKT